MSNNIDDLKLSEDSFRKIFRNLALPTYVWRKVGVSLILIGFNDAADEIVGRKMSNFIGIKASELYKDHPDNLNDLICCLRGEIVGPKEILYKYKELKESRDIRVFYTFLEPDLVLVQTEDISKQKQAENKLRGEKEKAENYLDLVHVIIVALDRNGIITLINKKGNEIFERTDGELIGKDWFKTCLPPRDRDRVHDYFNLLMNGNIDVIESYENPIWTKTGKEKLISWSTFLLQDKNGQVTGSISSGLDITEKREAEQKLLTSEKKYREAFNRAEFYKDLFTHDINNILQNILSASHLCKLFLDEPHKHYKLKELASLIKSQVKRGAKLVSNIRKLSEIEQSEMTLHSVNAWLALRSAIKNIKQGLQGQTLAISLDVDEGDIFVKANDLLSDIFDNLLNNAVKYNSQPKIKIGIKISKMQRDKTGFYKFEFIDNGMGIRNERKKRIFQRSNKKGVNENGGMGLGLSLVKKIIDSYKGDIWVEDRVKDEPSKGSNFIVLIPEA